jgi:hypothetical protein
MRRQAFLWMGLAVAVVAWNSPAGAQGASQGAAGAKMTTVTGCLAKGTDANTYTLTETAPASAAKEQSKPASTSGAAKSYQVMAKESSLKLTDHVGHTVTVTGTVEEMGGSTTGAAKGGGTGSTGGASGSAAGAAGSTAGAASGSASTKGSSGKAGSMSHLMATSLKHVSATCTP